jgi:sporulation protein YlmC with PRC-barrel domain
MYVLKSFGPLGAVCIAAAAVTAAERGRYVELAPPEVRRGRAAESVGRGDRKPFELIRVSRALSSQLRNEAGEQLGDIEELLIDTNRQLIAIAVIDCSEYTGVARTLVAAPWHELDYDQNPEIPDDQRTFTMNADKETLQDAPAFPVTTWPDLADQRWARDVYAHYGQEPYWERSARTPLRGEPISPSRGVRTSSERFTKPRMVKADAQMIGHRVQHATNGEMLGVVHELLIDPRTGDVAFMVLKLNGRSSVMRMQREKEFVALPTRMFVFDRYGDPDAPYVIECCLENLRSHRFSAANWPDLRSRAWALGLYLDFGRAPYWEQH